MRSKIRRIRQVVIIFAILALAYFLTKNGKPGRLGESIRAIFPQGRSHSTNVLVGGKIPLDPRVIKGNGNANPKTVAGFVKENSRNVESLALAFLTTSDLSYLEELKRHPESPIALEILAVRDGTAAERLYWAEKLHAMDPQNGMGKILLSRALDESGRSTEATTALKEAAAAESFDSSLKLLQPKLGEFLEKFDSDKRPSLVFGELQGAGASVARKMFPTRIGGFFNGKTKEEALALAESYSKIIDKASASKSLDLCSLEELNSTRLSFTATYAFFMQELNRVHPGAASQLTLKPSSALFQNSPGRNADNFQARLFNLTPSETDMIVKRIISSP